MGAHCHKKATHLVDGRCEPRAFVEDVFDRRASPGKLACEATDPAGPVAHGDDAPHKSAIRGQTPINHSPKNRHVNVTAAERNDDDLALHNIVQLSPRKDCCEGRNTTALDRELFKLHAPKHRSCHVHLGDGDIHVGKLPSNLKGVGTDLGYGKAVRQRCAGRRLYRPTSAERFAKRGAVLGLG